MSKYKALADRLAAHPAAEWRASAAELEETLGFPLPKAARARTWWKDGAWTAAGWTADPDAGGGAVTFRRAAPVGETPVGETPVGAAPAQAAVPVPAPAPGPGPSDEPPILKRLEVGPGWGVALALGGVAVVAGIGALVVRGMRRKS
jgi:hypothetical protein